MNKYTGLITWNITQTYILLIMYRFLDFKPLSQIKTITIRAGTAIFTLWKIYEVDWNLYFPSSFK